MIYSALGVGISGAIFFTIHSFAKPPPRTMTKEWQEATNEYLRVCPSTFVPGHPSNIRSPRDPILSMVFPAKTTRVKVTFRVNQQNHRASAWNQKIRVGGWTVDYYRETRATLYCCRYHGDKADLLFVNIIEDLNGLPADLSCIGR